MTPRVAVMIGAAMLVLAWLWWRGRQLRSRCAQREQGRGIVDEAAQAYEDIADEIISTRPDADPAESSRSQP